MLDRFSRETKCASLFRQCCIQFLVCHASKLSGLANLMSVNEHPKVSSKQLERPNSGWSIWLACKFAGMSAVSVHDGFTTKAPFSEPHQTLDNPLLPSIRLSEPLPLSIYVPRQLAQ